MWLYESPRWFPSSLDLERRELTLVRMSPETYRASAFLDHRLVSEMPAERSIGLDDASILAPEDVPPANFLFHVGYCGSTLVSRCLGDLPGVLSLREPYVLKQLAYVPGLLERPDGPRWLGVTLVLLSRRYAASDVTLVKPPSLCNLLARALLRDARSRAVFVYSRLEDFLAAHLTRASRRREAREFALLFRREAEVASPQSWDRPRKLIDAEVIAWLWWVQAMIFESLASLPELEGRLVALPLEAFLSRPHDMMSALAAHLGIRCGPSDVTGVLDGPAFQEYSKRATGESRPYGSTERLRELGVSKRMYSDEITAGLDLIKDAGFEEMIERPLAPWLSPAGSAAPTAG